MQCAKKYPCLAAELRECFPTSVLLGDIRNPLKKTEACDMKDISERGSNSNIFACLCTTNFCNAKDGARGAAPTAQAVGPPRRQQQQQTPPPRQSALQSDRRQPQPLQSNRRPDPREPVTRRPSTQKKTTRRPSSKVEFGEPDEEARTIILLTGVQITQLSIQLSEANF